MRTLWNKYLKDLALIYCALYTIATIINSIEYISMGKDADAAGNWHALDRAVVVLIVVLAYGLIRYLKIKNFFIKTAIVYVPTMALTFLFVWLRGFTDELASTAYRDIFINYTAGFIIVTVIAFGINVIVKKKSQ